MLLKVSNVNKSYTAKSGATHRALANINLAFESSGMVFIVGKSGSGKSTLLNVLGGLDRFDSGDVYVSDKSFKNMSDKDLDSYRNTVLGFVFQEFNLLENLTVRKNIELALLLQNTKDGKDAVLEALKKVDLEEYIDSKVTQISGGQRQRVSIARALVKDPRIIIADEPTGALDSKTATDILNTFKEISKTKLVIVVSHDMQAAIKYADRIVEIKDGSIVRDVRRKKASEPIEITDNEIESNANITANTIIKLEKGKKLNLADVTKINEIFQKSGKKAYINIETYKNKMKALFPALKEAIDEGDIVAPSTSLEKAAVKKTDASSELETINNETFVPTRIKDRELTQIKFKEGKFPTLVALKMGFNTLLLKKFSLVLTLLTSIITLVAFSLSFSMSNVNLNRSIAADLTSSNLDSLTISSARASLTSGANPFLSSIGDNQIDRIADILNIDKSQIIKSNNLQLAFSDINGFNFGQIFQMYSLQAIQHVAEMQNFEHLSIVGGTTPSALDQIMISDFFAQELVSHGISSFNTNNQPNLTKVNSVNQLVGSQFRFTVENTQINLTISGIYAATENINSNNNWWSIDEVAFFNDTMSFVQPGFISSVYQQINSYQRSIDFEMLENDGSWQGASMESTTWFSIDDDVRQVMLNGGITDFPQANLENTVIVLLEEGSVSNEEDLNNQFRIAIHGRAGGINMVIDSSQGHDIIAIYVSTEDFDFLKNNGFSSNDGESLLFFATSDITKRFFDYATPVSSIVVPMGTLNEVYNLLNEAAYLDINVLTRLTDTYIIVVGIVEGLSMLITPLSVILLFLSIVLLGSFVSQSIRITKKQIGILRALGSKKIDTFKIYTLEAFIIGLMSAVISIIIYLYIATSMISISIIVPSILNYVLIFGIAIIISLGASALALRKFNKITPVEAIANKEE